MAAINRVEIRFMELVFFSYWWCWASVFSAQNVSLDA